MANGCHKDTKPGRKQQAALGKAKVMDKQRCNHVMNVLDAVATICPATSGHMHKNEFQVVRTYIFYTKE